MPAKPLPRNAAAPRASTAFRMADPKTELRSFAAQTFRRGAGDAPAEHPGRLLQEIEEDRLVFQPDEAPAAQSTPQHYARNDRADAAPPTAARRDAARDLADDERRPWRKHGPNHGAIAADSGARYDREPDGAFDDRDFEADETGADLRPTRRRDESRRQSAERDNDGPERGRRLRRRDDQALRDEALRFVDASDESGRERRAAPVVDVDYEDVRVGAETDGRIGRRLRAERRRSTALARIDDFDPIAERLFNEDVFAALRVQPRELERALRKARRRAESREKNRLTPWRTVGWFVWLAVAGVSAFAVFTYRNEIVALWPKAAGAYAVIGIEASPYGLRIENVGHRLAMSTSGPTIEITGRLRNAGEGAATAPALRAQALGPNGETLSTWTFEVPGGRIEKNGVAEFTTRAEAPDGVAEVALSFAAPSGDVSINDVFTRRAP